MSLPDIFFSYSLAINEALHQTMAENADVFVMGEEGTKSPWYVDNRVRHLLDRFGPNRVIAYASLRGCDNRSCRGRSACRHAACCRASTDGFHALCYGSDLLNEAANWRYMSGGRVSSPVVFWGIVNRGEEQARSIPRLFTHCMRIFRGSRW